MRDPKYFIGAYRLADALTQPNSVAYAFYLAMVLHPRVMKKAQQELDAVVGTSRLPTFSDRASLPYTEALVTELLR